MNQTEYIVAHVRFYGYMVGSIIALTAGVLITRDGAVYPGVATYIAGVLMWMFGLSFASVRVNNLVCRVIPSWDEPTGKYDAGDFE